MKKRIFAVLLALALVVTVGAVAVMATDTEPVVQSAVSTSVEDAICPCGCGRKVTEIPEEEWQDWVFNTNLTDGHYRLAADQTGVQRTLVGSGSAPAKVLLDLNGFSITTASAYRGITIYTGGTATLIGEGTISGYAASAGVVEVSAGSTFNLYQATITNINTNTTKYAGGTAVSLSNSTSADSVTAFNMYSGTLNGGTLVGVSSSNKSAAASVYIGNYARFNMYDGVINAGTTTSKNGNAVYVSAANSEFNLMGGELVGSGKTANRGGLVYLNNGAMNMSGGILRGAVAGRGAGVFVNNGTFAMSDGKIVDCKATLTGMAVDVHKSGATFNMTGGTVSSDVTAGIGTVYGVSGANINVSGGTVDGNVCSVASITASGAAKITNVDLVNTTEGTAVATSITVGADGLTEKASIGVTAATGTAIVTNEKAADYAKHFYPADYRGKAQAQDNTIVLVADNSCPHCGGADATWSVWDGGAVATSGHYYLNADVTKTGGQIKIGDETNGVQDDIVLDLYGHTTNHTDSRYSIRGGDKLFLMDSGIGGELIGSTSGSGGAINLNTNAEFTLHSGKVTDGYTGTRGSGAYGGAIDFAAQATAIIKGGTVTGNNAIYGAAIGVRNGGTLRIEGGTIVGGTATSGGAIAVMGGTLEMISGTVTGGYATGNGGNIYIGSGSQATISGGTVTGGIMEGASNGGGNISVAVGQLTITGTAVIENGQNIAGTKDNNRGGGNIYNANGTVIISGGTIKNGTTNACGGNILSRGDLTISGGKIEGGTAQTLGNSVALRSYDGSALDAVVAVSGGNVNDIMFIRNGVQSFTVSGAPVIGNLDFTNLNESVTQLITLGENGVTGGSITVNAAENAPFSVADATLAESSKVYFHSAVEGLSVGVVDNCLVLMEPALPCPHCGQIVEWVNWTGGALNTADKTGIHYVLTKNITSGGQIAIGAGTSATADGAVTVDVVIDLNGYKITKPNRAFAVYAGSTLSLVNTGSASTVSGAYASADNGGVINVTGGSNLNLYENITVEMKNANYADDGGVVSIVGGGTFNLKGATLTGTTARYGGAVFVEDSTFNFEKGIINGGHIVSGTYTASGGAVYLADSNFSMTGGTITGGTVESAAGQSATYGGNLYISNSGDQTVTISGGIIENGTAINGNGGNILVANGNVTVSGTAQITGGKALRAIALNNGGGNIYGMPSANIAINGGSIANGVSNSIGANVFARGTLHIANRDIISGGSAGVAYAGEVAVVGANGVLTVDDLGADWSGDICLVNGATLTGDDVGAHLAYFDQRDFEIWYATLAEVKAADTEDTAESVTYIKLTADGTYDLDGHVVNVNGVTATINGVVTCFDTANDNYEGYGVVTLGTAPATNYIAPNGNLYITVKESEGQYSFHRLNMGFERLSIRPRSAGIYYSSSWNADNTLVGNWTGVDYEANPLITGYGMALKKNSAATGDSFTNGDKFAYTYFDNLSGETNAYLYNNKGAEINSCLLSNIINETNGADVNRANAEVMIYATPYVAITNYNGDTEYVMGPTYGNTLKGIVEWVVSQINAMEEADRTKNIGFIEPLNTFAGECGLADYFEGLATLVNG